jgi:hypothetical protein
MIWKKTSALPWRAGIGRHPWISTLGFCFGFLFSNLTNWVETAQSHQTSVLSAPRLHSDFLRLFFAPIGIVFLIWLVGTIPFPAKQRERALASFVASLFAGSVAAAIVDLGMQLTGRISSIF